MLASPEVNVSIPFGMECSCVVVAVAVGVMVDVTRGWNGPPVLGIKATTEVEEAVNPSRICAWLNFIVLGYNE